MKSYDIAVIGSGPGGYVAALYASRRRMSVALIEKDLVGGTCLNRGCIPTKALLASASILNTVKGAAGFGINVSGYEVDFEKVAARKDEVVLRLRAGLETLFRAAKIDLLRGSAAIAASDAITIEGGEDVKAKNIIIAAGSSPAGLPGFAIDEKRMFSSDGILKLKRLPPALVIVGGGVIGCEFAAFFNSLGTKVRIFEVMDRLVPSLSREASKKLEMIMRKRGVDIAVSSRFEPDSDAADVLVSVGRVPNTEGLGLEALGIKTEKGRIAVNEHLQTNVKNIYAIGDCVAGPQLAHKASYDGILACDNILGKGRKADYSNVPNCIWTEPEIASVGLNEEEARSGFPGLKVAKFPYLASGKAYLTGKTEGYIKIMGDADGKILGVEIFGAGACDLIAEAALAKTAGVKIQEWAEVIHGHPTLSEISQEAAHIFCGTPIHGM